MEEVIDYDPIDAAAVNANPSVRFEIDSSVGGGRRVVAAVDVAPGTVLMSERPFFAADVDADLGEAARVGLLSEKRRGPSVSAQHCGMAARLLVSGAARCPPMLRLHPISLRPPHLTENELTSLRGLGVTSYISPELSYANTHITNQHQASHSAAAHELVAVVPPDGDLEPEDEALRTMYHSLALVNHNCLPNCANFAPAPTGAAVPVAETTPAPESEIVATKKIAAGDEITIHYDNPVERSWNARQRLFREQHCFELGPTPFPEGMDELLKREVQATADRAEADLDTGDAAAAAAAAPGVRKRGAKVAARAMTALADSVSILERVCDPKTGLPANHIVTIRTHRAVTRASQAVLRAGKAVDNAVDAAVLGVRSSLAVRSLRSQYLGPDHHEIGEAERDLSNLLSYLIAEDPKRLYREFPEFTPNFSKASRAEFSAKREADRVKALYNIQ